MLSRRQALATCAGCAAAGMLGWPALAASTPGCVRGRATVTGEAAPADEQRSRRSGNAIIDGGMLTVLSTVLRVYGLDKALAEKVFFYQDEPAGNAEIRRAADTGEVTDLLLGRNLLMRTQQQSPAHYAAGYLGVLVHEFAHAYQIKAGCFESLVAARPSMMLVELHADFMTGWALPQMYFMRDGNVASEPAKKIRALGDTFFGSKDHHGTPHQRFAAISAGYIHGQENPSDADKASAFGQTHLQCLYDPEGGIAC